jgi:hypothetical protein
MSANEKRVAGWPGYVATFDGLIWSEKTERFLAHGRNKDGYLTVQVTEKRRSTVLRIHQEVCRAFHGPRPSRAHEVRHINGNKLDNRARNLRWGTRKQNAADRERHGRTAHSERNGGGGKLTRAQVRIIKSLLPSASQTYLATVYGVSVSTINHIATGRLWRRV